MPPAGSSRSDTSDTSEPQGFGRWTGAVIDLPADLVERSDAFWTQALGWTVGPDWPGLPEFHHLDPPEGHSHVLVQTVDGPPGLHLDLYADDVDQTASWMVEQGATLGDRHVHWEVLTSPTGFPFCVVALEGERDRPRAQVWPGGHRSRLVQVCLDVPHGRIDEETRFWRTITGWTFEHSVEDAFAGHLKPGAGGSLQLLLQELGADDPATVTRAHLDLGADDREAEVARLEALGARRVEDGRGWVVMEDPVGQVFCVTGQQP
jgi:hypothetical protein